MFDSPHVDGNPKSLYPANVANTFRAESLSAASVVVSASSRKSSSDNPNSRARSIIRLTIERRSSTVFGKPAFVTGRIMIAAPYFFASGRNVSQRSASTELISARPGNAINPASSALGSAVSIANGTSTN